MTGAERSGKIFNYRKATAVVQAYAAQRQLRLIPSAKDVGCRPTRQQGGKGDNSSRALALVSLTNNRLGGLLGVGGGI
jgi:hypothetical protein